jgi:hypothetical protein
VIDLIFDGAAWYMRSMNKILVRIQSGKIRHYALGIALGAVIFLGFVMFV